MRWLKFISGRSKTSGLKHVPLLAVANVVGLGTIGFLLGLSRTVQAATTGVPVNQDSFIYCQQDKEANEGDGVTTFTVTINSFTETQYTYKTADGKATSEKQKDYTYTDTESGGPLRFSSNDNGQIMASVSVPITNDDINESTEDFTLEIYSNNSDGAFLETSCSATILDDDPEVFVAPPVTTTPNPTPTPTPTPTTLTPPKPKPPVIIPANDPTPDTTPITPSVPQVLSDTQVIALTPPKPPKGTERSKFVQSVPTPQDLKPTFKKVAKAFVIAALLVLLIMFPADLFNGTLQSNYDEVIGWFKLDYVGKLHRKMQLHRMPIAIVLSVFAGLVTLLNVQLSPDFGFNRASGALLLGMFLALTFAATVYDLSRSYYLKKRFGISGKLRAHALGLGVGALFVTVSRLAHFVPGYLYGLFTGLIFKQNSPSDKQDGEGLALASVVILVLAVAGWFALVPVRNAATQPNASFIALVAEATLATLWVSALGMIVFSLAPLRFMYGEQVKKWNKYGWAAIYGSGMMLFVYTLLDPNQSVYGKSATASWLSVLSLFIGFAIFSFAFWGYFRYRPVRTQPIVPVITDK